MVSSDDSVIVNLKNSIITKINTLIGNHNSSNTAHSDIRNSIPTTTNQLTNNSGFLTSQDISGKANIADLATVATTGSYNDLDDSPEIPKMYDIEITSSNYNPDISTSLTITATATDYNGNPVIGETLTIKHNGTTVGTPTTNSNGVATVTTTCGSGGTHQFTCKSASCVVSVNPYPVGSIFTSVDSTSPATLFGGTWTQLTETFLYASTEADTFNTPPTDGTRGSKDAVVVSHRHAFTEGGNALAMDTSTAETSNGFGSGNMWSNTRKRRSSIASNGVSGTDKNMPPYMKVYMWKRTA